MQKNVNLVDLVLNSNEYLLAKIGVHTAENEPLKVQLLLRSALDPSAAQGHREHRGTVCGGDSPRLAEGGAPRHDHFVSILLSAVRVFFRAMIILSGVKRITHFRYYESRETTHYHVLPATKIRCFCFDGTDTVARKCMVVLGR